MSLMSKINIIDAKIDEMKTKLGLPQNSSLQAVVEKVDSGGVTYEGDLPHNASVSCELFYNGKLKINLKNVDDLADGVYVYWQKDTMPGPYEGAYIDMPRGVTSTYLEGLELGAIYCFRCASYVIVDNKKVFNNSISLGTTTIVKTIVMDGNVKLISLPEAIAGSTYNLQYNNYSHSLYVFSNKVLYKLNKDLTWTTIKDFSTLSTNYTAMQVCSKGVFVYNPERNSTLNVRFYEEATGTLYDTGLDSEFYGAPYEDEYGNVFNGCDSEYQGSANGFYKFNFSTKTFTKLNTTVPTQTSTPDAYVAYKYGSNLYFYLYGYSYMGSLFLYDHITDTLELIHAGVSGYDLGSSAYDYKASFKDLGNGMFVMFSASYNSLRIINGKTCYATTVKSSHKHAYYSASRNKIYYADANKIYKLNDDMTTGTLLSTETCAGGTDFIELDGKIYTNNGGKLACINEDDTVTVGTLYYDSSSYLSTLFKGGDGKLYWAHKYLFSVDLDALTTSYVKYGNTNPYLHHTGYSHIISSKGITLISASNSGSAGLYCVKDGVYTHKLIETGNNYNCGKLIDESHYLITRDDGLGSTYKQYLIDLDNMTATELDYYAGLRVLGSKYLVNNAQKAIYGYGEYVGDLPNNDFEIVTNNSTFAYLRQTASIATQAVLFNTAINVEFVGGSYVTQPVDEVYQEPGYTVYDDEYNDITDTVVVDSSEVQPGTPGVYNVYYHYTINGVSYTAIRKVEIVEVAS